MKIIIQTLFFFLLLTQICFGQWVQVGLNDESIKDVAVQNSNIFVVTLNDGKLFRSTDNGTNWTMIVDSNAVDIEITSTGRVFFIEDSVTHYFGHRSLFYSDDNGDTWIRSNIRQQMDSLIGELGRYCGPRKIINSPNGIIFCHLEIASKDYGGKWDGFAKSDDDGLVWTTPAINLIRGGLLFDFRNQFVITVSEFWGGGGHGNWAYLSSDLGNTWEHLGGYPAFPPHALILFSNGNIIVGGYTFDGKRLIMTSNMCSTWTEISSIKSQVGLSYSSGSLEGMLIGTEDLGVFLFSDEGDSLGSRNEGLTNLNIKTLTLDDNGYVYAGTGNGIWRRPLIELVTSVANEPTQPTEFTLSQNYPNPFNPSTKISWQSPVGSHQTLNIYDVLGNEVAMLVDEYKPAGSYEVEFDASRLASGVYFYQLKAGEYTSVKKMILIK